MLVVEEPVLKHKHKNIMFEEPSEDDQDWMENQYHWLKGYDVMQDEYYALKTFFPGHIFLKSLEPLSNKEKPWIVFMWEWVRNAH